MSESAHQPLLEIRDLQKSFGGIQAIQNLSLDVASGEVLGIIGPNGAGKTALINCITGFYSATSGTILFAGENITRLQMYEIGRRGIARTFQNVRLFRRMTVLENVVCGDRDWVARPLRALFRRSDDALRRAALELLDRMHLVDKADQLAGSLAYGEARRLEVARALATRPKLLFLDEPSAGMNEEETQALAKDIRRALELVPSMVVIEHDIEFIRSLSHRLVAMDYGRKIAEGQAAEVFANPLVAEAYLGVAHD
jgi:branched-chain amino acid transport system ATP-binding protein